MDRQVATRILYFLAGAGLVAGFAALGALVRAILTM